MEQEATIIGFLEKLKKIDVLCYSEEQGCPHLESLYEHININRICPENSYFIVKLLNPIGQEILADKFFTQLEKYIRFKTPNLTDFSRSQVDIPEIGKYANER